MVADFELADVRTRLARTCRSSTSRTSRGHLDWKSDADTRVLTARNLTFTTHAGAALAADEFQSSR